MTAKEYREKEQITDANFWNGCEIDFNMIYEFAEEYHNEQLRLHIVSQQRELLLAYHRYLTEELSLDLNEIWVDEHLKANNCG